VLRSVAVLIVAACARESSDPPRGLAQADTGRSVTAGSVMEHTVECVNRVHGYAVRYPAGWHVNTGDVVAPCSLFDPGPIEVPRDSEIPVSIAVMIGVEPVAFATLTGDVLGRREVSRQSLMVQGREAMRIDGESTGEGLYDRGIRSYEYFVALGDSTLTAATYGVGSLPLERKRLILDAMMETLEFDRHR
jgi:hypothetical protein